jgi:hypothetical protein
LTPSDLNPDPRTDPLNAPRTIAFWGRGVATKWRLAIDDPTVDLSALSKKLSENAQASLRTIRWIMAILIQASLVRGLIS